MGNSPWGNLTKGNFPRGSFTRGNFPRGSSPDTVLKFSRIIECKTCLESGLLF